MDKVIHKLSKEDRLNNHIPEEVWKLSRTHETYIEDGITGELIQLIDLKGELEMSERITIDFLGSKADQAVGMFFAWYTDGGGKEAFAKEIERHGIDIGVSATDLDEGWITQSVF